MTLAELFAAATPVALLVGLIAMFVRTTQTASRSEEQVEKLRDEVAELKVKLAVLMDRASDERSRNRRDRR